MKGEKKKDNLKLNPHYSINLSLVPLKRAVPVIEISFLKRLLLSETSIDFLEYVHEENTEDTRFFSSMTEGKQRGVMYKLYWEVSCEIKTVD